jgi:hypothetical protein
MRAPLQLRMTVLASTAAVVVASATAVAAPNSASAAVGGPATFTVTKVSTVDLASLGSTGFAAPEGPEIRAHEESGENALRSEPGQAANRLPAGAGTVTSSGKKAKSDPEVQLGFEGVNHRDSRLAFDGNQYSGEPPDQGVCVGNGYILETVNSALRVFSAADGYPVSNVIALNEFYGFQPAIDRTTGAFGPSTFDVSCHYDVDTDRWFHLAVDLEQDPVTGDYTGRNYLDLAVSQTGDPTGAWNIYHIPGMNDGTEGTPNHGCEGGPCFADFPHIGADNNGIYITTNEFPLFAGGFIGAQVYAISKAKLAAGATSFPVVLFNTADDPVRLGEPGFTVWPALSPDNQFAGAQGGTEYFVSSNAVFNDATGDSSELIVWALSNTESLSSATPSVRLQKQIVPSQRYAVPHAAEQKPGTIPLADCLNDTANSVAGVNCGFALFGLPPQNVKLGLLDASDSRVCDVRYANGKLWAVLGTAARVEGSTTDRAGVAWFVLNPSVSAHRVNARIRSQGILALADEALTYPSLGVTSSGRGVLSFTRVGPNLFPSAGYASLDDVAGSGPVKMAAEGQAPQDGFTEYPPIGGDRPRWGDYGAAAVDGDNVYVASEYIQQGSCTLSQYIATGLSCGDTRTALANWSTRVTKLAP